MSLDFLIGLDWAAVGQIILIDILLGGDNAVVIALACRRLPARQRTQGILWGTVGAIVMRVVLIGFAVALLQVPLLKIVGGLLLLWIGVRLLVPDDDGEHDIDGGTGLGSAIRTIIIADLVMSVDNVIGVAAAAEQAAPEHRMGLVIFGLLVSIPLIVWGSQLVIRLIERHAFVVWLGGALLGWIAGSIMIDDPVIVGSTGPLPAWVRYACAAIGATLVVVWARLLLRRRAPRP